MADKKISALTAASTPLAGSEVLPIVQGGSTVKVSVDNLTAGKEVPASKVTVSTGADALSVYIKGRSLDNASNIFFSNSADSAQYGTVFANASELGITSIGARPLSLGAAGSTAFQVNTTGNLVVIGAGKGIVDSTGVTQLNFTTQKIEATKFIQAPTFNTNFGSTASTPTATPVTLYAVSGDSVWIVNAAVTATGAPANYTASAIVKSSGGVASVTALSSATNLTITVSGLNVQATQTSGADQVIAYSAIRLF